MKDISIIGVVGICVYGLLSLYGLGCFLTLRYVAFLGDERIPYETPHEALIKRSVAILAYVFVATLLKLLFFIGVIVTEEVEIGFYVIYKFAALLLLIAVLLISKQLITIGGLIDFHSSFYIYGYLTAIVLITITIINIVLAIDEGIPSNSDELNDNKYKIVLYMDVSNELFRVIITTISVSTSGAQLLLYIRNVRSTTPVLKISQEEKEDARNDDVGHDIDLKEILNNLSLFLVYVLSTQISGFIVCALKLSDISNKYYYMITAFVFGDFLPDGGFVLSMLYLSRGMKIREPYTLARSNALYERLHSPYRHQRQRTRQISKPPHHHDHESEVIEHYFFGAYDFDPPSPKVNATTIAATVSAHSTDSNPKNLTGDS